MYWMYSLLWAMVVALLAEGVGRNLLRDGVLDILDRSPSSRRAWVEIALSGW